VADEFGRDQAILVAPDGTELGVVDKLVAHQPPGLLHLAFSVFLFDDEGRLLIQRRAATKYHFPLTWANSCCSHPQPGEDVITSAELRVKEELGLTCELGTVGSFTYRANCPSSGLVEHEFDWVLVGEITGSIHSDPSEVAEWRMLSPSSFVEASSDDQFAPWFSPALSIVLDSSSSGR
jgi:isopentenyl-diphosphate delta-isomerase